uniref:Uncharacterized protein n=1 Tax=Rhodopseudomonas palustris (strain BisA53) TaxID=316055 RepID=Q07HK3_RHOP5
MCRLPNAKTLWQTCGVKHLRNFRWVLAILTIASLVVAPLSRPAMAAMTAAGSEQAASHAMVGHDMTDQHMTDQHMTGHTTASHQMMPMADGSGDHVATRDLAGLSISKESVVVAAHEMPCCPSQAPMAPDCDKCLYMALCLAKYLTGMPSAIAQPMPIISASVITLRNEAWPDGLGHPPPEHPPRS